MTALDLKIKYRFATGLSPTYGKDGFGYNYRGSLTQDYAQWVESQLTNKNVLWKFQRNTSNKAAYINKHGNLIYTKAYREWLEEEFLRVYNQIFNESFK